MKFKTAIAAFLLATSSFVSADGMPLPVDSNGIVTARPSCLAGKVPIAYFYTTDVVLNVNNAATAMAMPNPTTGLPAIFMSFKEFQTFSPEFQMWVLAHECAHWELGHIYRSYAAVNAEYDENAADCKAAHHLVKMGFSDKQLNTVLEGIVETEDRRMQFAPAPPKGVTKHKSKAEQRSQNARVCMEEAKVMYAN